MTRELWDLIEEYIDARLELEKVPEDLRDDLAYGPVKPLRDIRRLRADALIVLGAEVKRLTKEKSALESSLSRAQERSDALPSNPTTEILSLVRYCLMEGYWNGSEIVREGTVREKYDAWFTINLRLATEDAANEKQEDKS